MEKNKTDFTSKHVYEFINSFASTPKKAEDSFKLIKFLTEVSDEELKMWGPSIIGFGVYQYKYASGHGGNSPILGFSPGKSALTLYVYSDTEKSRTIIKNLGNFKMGKACIYIKNLEDIDLDVLKELCIESIRYINQHNEYSCRRKY